MKFGLFAAALLCGVFVASPSSATKYLVTYTGTLSTGVDGLGFFGPANFSLGGLTFSAQFILDTAKPGAPVEEDPPTSRLFGNAPSVPVKGTITVNGVLSPHRFGKQVGNAVNVNGLGNPGYEYYGYDEISHLAMNYGGRVLVADVRSFANDFLATSNLTAPLSYTVKPDDTAQGYFTWWNDALTSYTAGNFIIAQVTAAQAPAAVPEPATWAMVIGGFAVAGAALRRRSSAMARA